MKKDTKHIRADIVNKSLSYIYKNISTNITLDELARLNSVSRYHFHRIFKEETTQNLFERISEIRLQKAANFLITNQYSSISEIKELCGYSSHSSFIKAFKNRFSVTPSKWREGAYKNYLKRDLKFDEKINSDFFDIKPIIGVAPKRVCAYIRHKGYDSSISTVWERLIAYAYEKEINNTVQIGIFHDNPLITPYGECHYVAALEVDDSFISTNSISSLEIEESLCAIFHYEGKYGDVVKLMEYIYIFWLRDSGYESTSFPPYVIYYKNHFLKENESFNIDFYIPISVV